MKITPITHRLKGCLLGLFMGTLAACGGGSGGVSGGEPTGTLTIILTDAPVDDVTEVWVEFSGVTLQPQGGGSAIEIPFPGPLTVDLMSLTDGISETLLASEPIPAGAYNWVELHVNAEFDGNDTDSYVTTDIGGQEEVELEIPGGAQTGLRFVSGLTITADQETSFLIDWDLRMGLVNPPGQPGYFLRPALRIIDMTQFGTLSGSVEASLVMDMSCTNDLNADTGNAVYVFSGSDVVPDDIDDVDPNPVATAAVSQDQAGQYRYELLLSPGVYTAAFTCQASDDHADVDDSILMPIAFVQRTNVTVVNGGTVILDFS